MNPCALRTLEGAPVSIFHVGSAKFNKVVHDDHLQRRWMEAMEKDEDVIVLTVYGWLVGWLVGYKWWI